MQRNATAWKDPAEEVAVLFYIGLTPRFDEFVAPTPISLRAWQPRLYKPRSPLAEENRERDHSARMALCIPDDYD